jgi:hypothetical protein
MKDVGNSTVNCEKPRGRRVDCPSISEIERPSYGKGWIPQEESYGRTRSDSVRVLPVWDRLKEE